MSIAWGPFQATLENPVCCFWCFFFVFVFLGFFFVSSLPPVVYACAAKS